MPIVMTICMVCPSCCGVLIPGAEPSPDPSPAPAAGGGGCFSFNWGGGEFVDDICDLCPECCEDSSDPMDEN